MRKYDYNNIWKKFLTPEIVTMLSTIHELKGEQNLFIKTHIGTLAGSMESAKIQSIEASNKIEGILASAGRLKKLVANKTTPKTRNEMEIAGYRDVLITICESYEYIPIRPSILLQLHRDLYKFSGKSVGGTYKNSDNVIVEKDPTGDRSIRFQPVPAWEVSQSIEEICEAFDDVMSQGVDPLLIIPMFILDFLCIHPFNDGNGRMSRLLTLLLLYRAGYVVGKYISIEGIIEASSISYYEALQRSSKGWHKGANDYTYFVRYMLKVILTAYREFSIFIQASAVVSRSKPEKIREIIKGAHDKITKSDIMAKCPDISQVTVQRALSDMLKNGDIIKIGGGRYTSYIWNRKKA